MTGAIVWFTGLPASGKTTLATRVHAAIGGILLDSDVLREVLEAGDHADRDGFYRRLAALATTLAHQGHVVLVAATASLRRYRDAARAIAPSFIEVHVTTPLAECERRDPKQLYLRARRGDAPLLPGVGAPYEAPLAPEVTASGGDDARAIRAIVGRVQALVR